MMRLVVNKAYGGFGFSKEFKKAYPQFSNEWEIERADEELLEALEKFGLEEASGGYADLEIVELDGEVTDYLIEEYDGAEIVYYVVDGKIHCE